MVSDRHVAHLSLKHQPGLRLPEMNTLKRITRHVRLTARATVRRPGQTLPFLITFINSTCSLTREHCFFWRNLDRRDDLMMPARAKS